MSLQQKKQILPRTPCLTMHHVCTTHLFPFALYDDKLRTNIILYKLLYVPITNPALTPG